MNIARKYLEYQFKHESMESPTLLMSIVNSKNQQYSGNAPIVLLRTMDHGNIKGPPWNVAGSCPKGAAPTATP